MSTPTSKKEADSSGSSSSSSQDAASNSRILSSKRVGDYIYQLVGYPQTDGIPSPGTETATKPQAKEGSDQPRQQKARKTFSPQFKVPPHLLGRTTDNPEADAVYGKKLQKPRPGVKVPSLNLTSQILSKEELCQEVVQRTIKKQQPTVLQPSQPELARTLSSKLAHKISEGSVAASTTTQSTSLQSPQSSSTNLPADESAIEVVIIEDEEEEKASTDDTSVPPMAGSGPVILNAVSRKSLLGLMKKEYVSGLNLSTKSTPSQGNLDVPQNILTPPLEPANGSESDSTVKNTEADNGSSASKVDIPIEESSESRSNNVVSSTGKEDPRADEDSKPASPISHVDNISYSTQPRDSGADLEPLDGDDDGKRDLPVIDSDVMDVEAAMAALHGEVLENEANVSAEDNKTDVDDTQLNLGDPVIVDVRSIKAEAVKRKRRRGGRQSVSAKAKPAQLSQGMKSTSKSRPNRRELDRLFIDEGAINMLCDMEKRGLAGRRSGSSNERTTLIPKELLNHKTLQKIRSTRLQRRKWEPVTEFKRRRGAKKADEITQQEVLRHWQALTSLSGDSAEEVVYVPRQFANPADASQIVRRRSCSSESSVDPNPDDKKKTKKRKEGSSLAITISSHQAALHDHGYMAARQQGADSDISRASDSGSHGQCGDYQEFNVRFKENFVHVVFSPRSSILPNSFNATMLMELTTFLRQLKENQQISVVLFTSSGSSFCTGLDFPTLINENPAARQDSANRMALLINEFITELANCDKLLVAGLNGSVIGIGLTMLPYFDIVYASDKAVFHLPYAKLGQGTEGAVALTFRDHVASRTLVSALVYEGRHLTATEVEQRGLVNSVLWPACFQEDLIARVQKLAAQATRSMLSTKKLLRASLRRELPSQLEEENRLLVQNWTSDDFQRRARQLFESGELLA